MLVANQIIGIMPSKKPRVTAVLPDHVYIVVDELAIREERSQSQMAAILIREALKARGFDIDSDRQTQHN